MSGSALRELAFCVGGLTLTFRYGARSARASVAARISSEIYESRNPKPRTMKTIRKLVTDDLLRCSDIIRGYTQASALLRGLALPCFSSPLPHFRGALPGFRCLPILLRDFLPLGSCFLERLRGLLPFSSRVLPLLTVQTLCSLTIPRNIVWLHRLYHGLTSTRRLPTA